MFVNLLFLILSQDIKLPEKIEAKPSEFVFIKAETEGNEVIFVSLSDDLVLLPNGLLAEKKATVGLAKRNGEFKVLAYTSLNNKPSLPAYTIIKVGDKMPEPMPPEPKDDLYETLSAIYGADTSVDKLTSLKKLVSIWNIVYNTKFNVSNNGELMDSIKMIFAMNNLDPKLLRPIRDVLAGYLRDKIGDDPDKAYDDVLFKKTVNTMIKDLARLGE